MYLEYIKAKNFGRVEDKHVDLVDGLIVVRSPNGAGKSTLFIQVPLYVMFGSTMLDSSVDETVLEGAAASSMFGEIKYGPYVARRSKSSASVEGPGVKISGQGDVTNFFENLLGAKKESAEMLLVSLQGEAAGLVGKRNAQIMSFIEQASDMGQIDQVIEAAKAKYPYGLKDLYEEAIGWERENFQSRTDSWVEAEEMLRLANIDFGLAKIAADSHRESVEQAQKDLAIVESQLKLAASTNSAVELAEKRVKTEEPRLSMLESRLTSTKQKMGAEKKEFKEEDLTAAKAYLAGYEGQEKIFKEYSFVLSNGLTEDSWDGGEESFSTELSNLHTKKREISNKITEYRADIKVEKSKISNTTICPTCGTDISSKVSEINASAQTRIKVITEIIDTLEAELVFVKNDLVAMESINTAQSQRKKIEFKLGGEWDKTTVPWVAKWAANIPSQPSIAEANRCQKLLSDKQANDREMLNYANTLKDIEGDIAVCSAAVAEAKSSLAELGNRVDTAELEDTNSRLSSAVSVKKKELKGIENRVDEISSDITKLTTSITIAKDSIEKSVEEVRRLEGKIKEDQANAAMLKAMREAKPRVLDKVWGGILVAVSEEFKAITGLNMDLAKGGKSFLLGKRPMSRLSGSEKSMLGLCFRSVLRDMFAPGAGFMIFDEIFADCDKERAAAGLAALQQIRNQKIVITHEQDTELAADQVIEI